MKLPVPDRIATCPEILPWLHGEFEAFFELSTCRTELNPIPWTAVHQYAVVNGFANTYDDLRRFSRLIRAMDREYLSYWQGKREKSLKDAQSRAKAKAKGKGGKVGRS